MGAKVLISSFKANLWNHIFQENCYLPLIEFIGVLEFMLVRSKLNNSKSLCHNLIGLNDIT